MVICFLFMVGLNVQHYDRMTRRQGRGSATRGWSKEKPGTHERTVMLQKCGHSCFLGPNKTFPICTKGTCRINVRGVHAAFSRSRQWKHPSISRKAKAILRQLNGLTKKKRRV